MKKLLVLMLVLGMASVASAGLLITNDGADPGDQINVLDLGVIGVDSDSNLFGFEFKLELDLGTIDASGLTYPETWMFAPYFKGQSDSMIDVTGGDFFEKTGPLTVLTGITLGVSLPPNAVLSLISTASADEGTVYDTLTIVPEPISLVLLGIGGLFLRRRK